MGTLDIRRDSNYFGAARRLVIYVDGTKVAKLRPEQLVSLELPAGDHRVRARMDWVTCKPLVVNVTSEFVRTRRTVLADVAAASLLVRTLARVHSAGVVATATLPL